MSRIVYRIIRDDEDLSNGLWAKNLHADDSLTVEDHVFHGKQSSPWISMTCSAATALKYNMMQRDKSGICRIVAIDLDELETTVEDCRNRNDWCTPSGKRYSNVSQELCVYGCIPERAILGEIFTSLDIEEIEKPLSSKDISALTDINKISGDHKNISSLLPNEIIQKYNKEREGEPVTPYSVTDDFYRFDKKSQKEGLDEFHKNIAKLSTMLDKAIPKYIESGQWDKARAAMLAVSKYAYTLEKYMQQEFKEIETRPKDIYGYSIPEVPLEYGQKYPKKTVNFKEPQRRADKFFDSLKLSERRRVNTCMCGENPEIIAGMGEKDVLVALQKQFGGELYSSGNKWIATVDKDSVIKKVQSIFRAEKDFVRASEAYTQACKDNIFEKKISPEKMKQYKEDYQIARMAYMEELGKDCDRIPPDFWKANGFDR